MKIAKVNIKGIIVSNEDAEIYEWYGYEVTSPKMVDEQIAKANGEELEVYINSPGGYVDVGSEIYSTLKEYAANVTTKIVGVAASAASVVAMGGDKVVISPTAQIMIHNTTTIAWGDYRAFRHEAGVLENYNKAISNAYILKTGLTQDELLSLMDEETWFTAQQAVDKRFADEIMFDADNQLKVAASYRNSFLLPPEVISKTRNELARNRNNEPPTPTNSTEQPLEPERTPKAPLSLLQKKMNLRGRVIGK